jgi:hypothetical protein
MQFLRDEKKQHATLMAEVTNLEGRVGTIEQRQDELTARVDDMDASQIAHLSITESMQDDVAALKKKGRRALWRTYTQTALLSALIIIVLFVLVKLIGV